MDLEFAGFAPQGWQCPVCKHVYSPTIPMCWYCGGNQTTTVSTGTDVKPGFVSPINEWGNTKTGSCPDDDKKGE